MAIKNDRFLRIGVFYDGTYFSHVSNYYLHSDPRNARLSIEGLHQFIRTEVSREEQIDERFCQIVDAHYFRGRLSARQSRQMDADFLYRERQFDDVLIREGVTLHHMPVAGQNGTQVEEKGIDVWFALEAFELALLKKFDIVVLVTGDGDFVPLVRKLNTHGARVMLLAWDLDAPGRTTRTSQALINEVTYPIMMHSEITSRGRKKDLAIDHLFVKAFRDEKGFFAQGQPHSDNQCGADPSEATDQSAEGGIIQDRPKQPCALEIKKGVGVVASQWKPTQAPTKPEGGVTGNGVVCHYVADRGFGFIRPDDDPDADQIFFHISAVSLDQQSDICLDAAVSYCARETVHGGRTRLQATLVEVVSNND